MVPALLFAAGRSVGRSSGRRGRVRPAPLRFGDWDANGNLTDNGTLKFEYNYKNLIVKVRKKSDSSLIATYRYDALGRRVEKDTGDVERYIRSTVIEPGDQDNISHAVAVYDGSNNWLQNFVWNDEVDGIQMLEQADVLDYDTDGNTTEVTRSFYHRNALGSVMEISDLNQATAVSYRYDPYGKVTITRGGTPQTTDPLGQHWTFTGRFFDAETKLMYYRARYYDPGLGRFLQRDPLGYAEGPNLFSYVDDSPVNRIDPSGRGLLVLVIWWLYEESKPAKAPPRAKQAPRWRKVWDENGRKKYELVDSEGNVKETIDADGKHTKHATK